jgi:hypothetical protein
MVTGVQTCALPIYVIFQRSEKMKAAKIPGKLTLNVTLRKSLETMFGGTEIQKNWVGKRVTLYTGRDYRPDIKAIGPCIRIKGSPDISSPVSFVITKKLSKPVTHTLLPIEEKK